MLYNENYCLFLLSFVVLVDLPTHFCYRPTRRLRGLETAGILARNSPVATELFCSTLPLLLGVKNRAINSPGVLERGQLAPPLFYRSVLSTGDLTRRAGRYEL